MRLFALDGLFLYLNMAAFLFLFRFISFMLSNIIITGYSCVGLGEIPNKIMAEVIILFIYWSWKVGYSKLYRQYDLL